MPPAPRHLMSLADLSVSEINHVLQHSFRLKQLSKKLLRPVTSSNTDRLKSSLTQPPQSLALSTIALLFSKRSTRTRVAAETSTVLLGGRALFLGKEDIQLGVNETVADSARVLSGMCQGIFARVGAHEEIEELAKHSEVPVINALSAYWHPTQILADLLTMHEHPYFTQSLPSSDSSSSDDEPMSLKPLRPLTITWVGDSSNVLHDMLVTFPRLGHKMRVATPSNPAYQCPKPVWDVVEQLGCDKGITWTDDPKVAVKDADVVITDTWISMGQEAEKAQRLKDFQGYQVTEKLCEEGAAKPDWKFMHCLPRKQDEVNDEVFYGERSLVFPEAENRKWTIMALFDMLFGHHKIFDPSKL